MALTGISELDFQYEFEVRDVNVPLCFYIYYENYEKCILPKYCHLSMIS